MLDKDEPQLLTHVLRDLLQVLLVLLGQDHGLDTRPVRGQDLLFHPADRQHFAAQRDLAGHSHVLMHRPAGHRRRQRRGQRDAG